MIYNDRSVLENHHLSVAFRLLQNPDIDILDGLSSDEFKVPLTDLNGNNAHIIPYKGIPVLFQGSASGALRLWRGVF